MHFCRISWTKQSRPLGLWYYLDGCAVVLGLSEKGFQLVFGCMHNAAVRGNAGKRKQNKTTTEKQAPTTKVQSAKETQSSGCMHCWLQPPLPAQPHASSGEFGLEAVWSPTFKVGLDIFGQCHARR